MNGIISNLKKQFSSSLIRNSFTLLTANGISQLISIAIYPIIARLYSPSDFGTVSYLLSIVSVLTIVASGKFESAIFTERDKANSAAVFDLVMAINVIVTTISFILMIVLYLFKDQIPNMNHLGGFLYLVPVIVFINTSSAVLVYWFNSKEKFSISGVFTFTQNCTNSFSKIAFGWMGFTKWGLILSSIIGPLSGLIVLAKNRTDLRPLLHFNWKRMKGVAINNISLFKFTMPHSLINSLSANVPILLLSAYFNMGEIGLFSLAVTLGFRPISLFADSMNQVLFQKVTQNNQQGIEIYPLIWKFTKKTILLTLPFFLAVSLFIKPLTILLFTSKWEATADYLLMMMPWLLFTVVASSICFVTVVANRQKEAMLLEIVYLVLKVIVLFLGIYFKSIFIAILLYSTVSGLFVLGLTIWYLRLSKVIDIKMKTSMICVD